jgi:pre-rRNA-processing protein TSR1
MFFHPKDIKFFKPVEVRTKMGLRGRIEESLGTHGLMKVMFSDQIKHNDTVCMSLYNRVYPKAEF